MALGSEETFNCRIKRLTFVLSPGSQRVCSQCARATARRTASRASPILPLSAHRYYATEPATPSTPQPPRQTPPPPPPPVTTTPRPTAINADPTRYRIKSGLILTRPPLLTREQTPFESAFYLYQKRLDERLTAPFRPRFYFKKDTAADLDWRIKLRERHGVPAKDIGRYNPKGRQAWNDEVLVGSTTPDPANIVERLLADAEVRISEDGEPIPPEDRVPVERPQPRRTEADEKNDVRRLDRALDRTLYLIVRKKAEEVEGAGVWEFPAGHVLTEETLHEVCFYSTFSASLFLCPERLGQYIFSYRLANSLVSDRRPRSRRVGRG